MALTRRAFPCRTLVVGPVAMKFWIEADRALARGVDHAFFQDP